MKTTISFSIERDVANKFLDKFGDTKNRIVEEYMTSITKELLQPSLPLDLIGMSECLVCKAIYSMKLTYCPQCRALENEKKLLKSEEERDKVVSDFLEEMKKIPELDILNETNIGNNTFLIDLVDEIRTKYNNKISIMDIIQYFKLKNKSISSTV